MDNVMIAFATLLLETAKAIANNGDCVYAKELADKAVEIFDKATVPVAQFAVHLQSCGDKKVSCIKVCREYNSYMGLKEAKELVERAPCVVLKTTDEKMAMEMWSDFREIYGVVARIIRL